VEVYSDLKDDAHHSIDGCYASSEHSSGPWQHHVRYVYDAAAERTQQRIKDLVNGAH
jgi:hypothetical protein